MNRETFFDEVRRTVFRGRLSQSQVDGLNILLDVWEGEYSTHPRGFLSYCLATAYHETAHTMQPIREYGRGRGRKYGRKDKQTGHAYYGRGYVQLTWKANYKKAGDILGKNFVDFPDLVMTPHVAAHILYRGCIEGWFTSHTLARYISRDVSDFKNARRIVNGMDKASKIAGYAWEFDKALEKADWTQIVPDLPKPFEPDDEPSTVTRFLESLVAMINAFLKRSKP